MRRVDIFTGIKQRLNEILGTQVAGESTGSLTSWSIQEAMLSNFRRMGKAMAGGSTVGKVISGLGVTQVSTSNTVSVAAGYGVTTNGDMISILTPFNVTISPGSDENYLCLRYNVQPLPLGEGKFSSKINEEGSYQLVYDETGASGDSVDSIVEVKTSLGEIDSDLLLVATVTMSGISLVSISGSLDSSSGQVVVGLNDGTTTIDFLNNTPTTVVFPDVTNDTSYEYNNSNGLYTAKTAGFRQVSWAVSVMDSDYWTDNLEYFQTYLSINGADIGDYCFRGTYRGNPLMASGVRSRESAGSALVYLKVDETLSLKVYQNSGNTMSIPPILSPYTPPYDYEKNSCYLTISTR